MPKPLAAEIQSSRPGQPEFNSGFIRWLSRLVITALSLGCVLAIAAIQTRTIRRAPAGLVDPVVAQSQTQIRLKLLQTLPTLGFDHVIANWAFLDYLQYFGDSAARQQSGYGAIGDYFDLIVARDPRFLAIYPFLSAGVSYYAGQPERAIALMEKGSESMSPRVQPQAFWIWRFVAFDRFLLLGDNAGAVRAFEQAAAWAGETTEFKDFEPFFMKTARALRRDINSLPVRFYAWNSVYQEAIDAPIRERAERELILLGAQKQKNRAGQVIFVLPAALEKPQPSKQ